MRKIFCDVCKEELKMPVLTVTTHVGDKTKDSWLWIDSLYNSTYLLVGTFELCFDCSMKLMTMLNSSCVKYVTKRNR